MTRFPAVTLHRRKTKTRTVGYVVYAITDQGVPAAAERKKTEPEAWALAREYRRQGFRTHIEPQTASL